MDLPLARRIGLHSPLPFRNSKLFQTPPAISAIPVSDANTLSRYTGEVPPYPETCLREAKYQALGSIVGNSYIIGLGRVARHPPEIGAGRGGRCIEIVEVIRVPPPPVLERYEDHIWSTGA